MKKAIHYIGLDVHADSITIAIGETTPIKPRNPNQEAKTALDAKIWRRFQLVNPAETGTIDSPQAETASQSKSITNRSSKQNAQEQEQA